jgi:branched-chain amino acid transport system ATP-binding protein
MILPANRNPFSTAPVLVVKDVSKSFGPISVLEGVTLQLGANERRALIGPNGAGKSTLFNLISGRLAPTKGSILLHGRRIDGKPPHRLNRAGLSRSFQITHIFDGLSIFDNVYLSVMSRYNQRWALIRWGSKWNEIRREAEALLDQAQLAHLRNHEAGTLAYSEQRALEICMTVATGASVILLDEPTAGMSRAEAANMVAFIARMTADRSLLVVEHDMDVVFELADTISVLVQGKILATGTKEEISNDQRVQDAYLGGGTH